jgi:hypothetical protein
LAASDLLYEGAPAASPCKKTSTTAVLIAVPATFLNPGTAGHGVWWNVGPGADLYA